MQNVIVRIGLLAILLAGAGVGAQAQTALERKVDSLFVIASSGEIRYQDMVEPAKEAIAALGAAAVPRLIEKFTTRSARERWAIVQILEKIGSPAVPDLVEALTHPDDRVVARICWALGTIKDSSATEPLIGVTSHTKWQIRDEAIGALGKIGDTRGAIVAGAALNDTIGQVRKAAAVACRRLKLNGYERELVHQLGDDFYGARMCAVDALLELDTGLVIEIIADSAYSANPLVSNLGCHILARLGTDAAIDTLYEIARTDDPELRARAVVALIEADPDDLCGYHEKLVSRETDRLVRLKIESALHMTRDER